MAKFFVGQRVRIAFCENPGAMIHVGKEGRIMKPCAINPFCFHVDVASHTENGTPLVWRQWHLEPILPEGSVPSEFTFQQLMDSLQEATA